jgi:hypothetical protein
MNKKNLILITFAVALGVVYVVFFTEWFRPQTVKIFHTTRFTSRQRAAGGAMPELMFGLSQKMPLSEITVISLDPAQTNLTSVPLWHLISNSNSVPVKSFFYGQYIRGLKPAVAGSRPEPLATNVPYRLIVQSGKIKGQHDFELK